MGNVYCHEWDKFFDGVARCYQRHKNGDRYIMKNVDAVRSRNIPVRHIEQGNPLGFSSHRGSPEQ